jgi:hypothetical protein
LQVEKINALEPIMRELTDGQLRDKTQEFKNRVAAAAAKDKANGGKNALDGLLVEAFAVLFLARKASIHTWCFVSLGKKSSGGMEHNPHTIKYRRIVDPSEESNIQENFDKRDKKSTDNLPA